MAVLKVIAKIKKLISYSTRDFICDEVYYRISV